MVSGGFLFCGKKLSTGFFQQQRAPILRALIQIFQKL
jgi:hypothetical protein